MLVLTRKKEEKLQIGEQVTITVLRIKGNCVQLGIEAPRAVRVMRQELLAAPACQRDSCSDESSQSSGEAASDGASGQTQQQRSSRLSGRGTASGSLHALVAQVFQPAHDERLISVG